MTDNLSSKVYGDAPKRDGIFYLWHLQAIGLLPSDESVDGTVEFSLLADTFAKQSTDGSTLGTNGIGIPFPIPERSRVAIIDNGVNGKHPALVHSVTNPMDFTVYPQGMVFKDLEVIEEPIEEEDVKPDEAVEAGQVDGASRQSDTKDADNPNGAKRNAKIEPPATFAGLFGHNRRYEKELRSLLEGNRNLVSPPLNDALEAVLNADNEFVPTEEDQILDSARTFAAHGTACAGLVSGYFTGDTSDPANFRYFGVNPFAEVVPITTTYDQRYWPIVLSLLYSLAQNADVILMPRAIEDLPVNPEHREGNYIPATDDPRVSRIDTDKQRKKDYELLVKLIKLVSKHVPLVVPSGNAGLNQLEFPAKLVLDEAPDLIVVGAANALGIRSSYSNWVGSEADHIIYGPSDDREEISEEHLRLDFFRWRARHLKFGEDDRINCYSPYGVVTLDLPGRYGYNVEPGDSYDFTGSESHSEYETAEEFRNHSLFTIFGGTSAASSTVAGFISLMQQLRKPDGPLSGAEAKKILFENFRFPARAFHEPLLAFDDEVNESLLSREATEGNHPVPRKQVQYHLHVGDPTTWQAAFTNFAEE